MEGSQKHGLIRQAIEYIYENYETDLSTQQAAAQLRLSPYQLSRFFKEETGMTFVDYVID
ncbi:AraC family transcriptional regulator [Paenibacillus contaminans]|uniref:AraC family transcriptional regulator n=1 Tax=Paenibacillus contaminans TaxID=450362 RepID=UPI0013146A07|nr:AraC family transcriptional regulator [Paenibacillus contaminans]